jgi:hypothetical protein
MTSAWPTNSKGVEGILEAETLHATAGCAARARPVTAMTHIEAFAVDLIRPHSTPRGPRTHLGA